MIELRHRSLPTPELSEFLAAHPDATVSHFDSASFRAVKKQIKADLNVDQGGLCVYCEKKLNIDEGQLEHIKPKAGKNAHPELCFTYTNLAHSCINAQTCGQGKKNGLLPIEPSPGCNKLWTLSTNGTIVPIEGLTAKQNHEVRQTRDMLGLNKDTDLVDERKRWFEATLEVLRKDPNLLSLFMQKIPYRDILAATLQIG